MAEEHRNYCKYCNSDYGDREYGLHRLSNAHMKKVRMELMQLSFHNCIALEAHRLMPLHRKEGKTYHYPKLNELLNQVSGLPGEELATHVTSLCRICDVQLDSLDTYLMHLFTTAHIGRVRHSECFMCSKAFIHAENREAHLVSSKHVSALQKGSHGLKEGSGLANLFTKGGYPCMVCMIWCKSWLCLELHLLYIHHADALRLSNKDLPVLAKMNFILPTNADDDVGSICDVSHVQRWKEWRGSVLKEHAWCHVCGISLPNLDVVNEHLNMHEIEDFPSTLPKKHVAQQVLECCHSPQLFNCCLCALSFKSALMLLAHEACIGHHCRLLNSLANPHFICCANCGVMVDDEEDGEMGDDRKKVIKSTSSCMKSYQGLEVKPMMTSDLGIPLTSNGPNTVVPYVCKQDKSCVYNVCHPKEERSPIECNANGDVSPFPLINDNRVNIDNDAQAHTADVTKKTTAVRCSGKSSACPDKGGLNSGAHVLRDPHVKIPVVTAAALVPLGALQQSMQSITTVVAEALLKSLQRFMQNQAKRKPETDDQPGKKKHCSEQKTVDHSLQSAHVKQTFATHSNPGQDHSAHSSLGDALDSYAGTEKAEISTTDDKSLWQEEALLVTSALALPNPLPDFSALLLMHAEAMLTKGKQVIAMDSADDACTLADKLDDTKTSAEQSVKDSQCHSVKASQCHSNNEIASTRKGGLGFKARESPELSIQLDMSSHCIKREKHAVDDEDSLNFSNNFKDADLWWVLSDSEDGESSHKQKRK